MPNAVADWFKRMTLPHFLNLLAVALLALLVIRVQRGLGGPRPADGGPETVEQRAETARKEGSTSSAGTSPVLVPADTGLIARVLASDTTVQRVTGVGTIDETLTPLSFWIEENGERMLVIMIMDGRDPRVADGHRVRLDSALIKRNGDTTGIPKAVIQSVRALAAEQRAYLQIKRRRVTVLPQGEESN